MKLWEKSTQPLEEIDRFTVGHDRELDLYLAPYDVLGSMAHVTMLHSISLIADNELQPLLNELRHIYHTTQNGQFVIEDGIEDVHSQVELMLTRKLGDMGKKIHSGRSRNDQVLVDLKLYTRHKLQQVIEAVKQLFDELQKQSERYKHIIMPGYTHLQVAMPQVSDYGSEPTPKVWPTTCSTSKPHGDSPTATRSVQQPDTARHSPSTDK